MLINEPEDKSRVESRCCTLQNSEHGVGGVISWSSRPSTFRVSLMGNDMCNDYVWYMNERRMTPDDPII